MLTEYQQRFIDIALQSGALKFGEFKLKSGRISPYFFNAGHFDNAHALHEVGECYAAAIQDADFKDIDLLFGPAYKGIPLTTCTATALYSTYQRNIACAFNRKEKKDHGEGGQLIGATIRGNVLIIDDVITAGTAVREVIELLKGSEAQLKGLVIGLNRQEKGINGESAITELEREFGLKVHSIISAEHLLQYLELRQETEKHRAMAKYLEEYGV